MKPGKGKGRIFGSRRDLELRQVLLGDKTPDGGDNILEGSSTPKASGEVVKPVRF